MVRRRDLRLPTPTTPCFEVMSGGSISTHHSAARSARPARQSLSAMMHLNGESRKAMADQIATVSKQRLKSRLGTLSLDDLGPVERAIRVQLSL